MKRFIAKEIKNLFKVILYSIIVTGIGYAILFFSLMPHYLSVDEQSKIKEWYKSSTADDLISKTHPHNVIENFSINDSKTVTKSKSNTIDSIEQQRNIQNLLSNSPSYTVPVEYSRYDYSLRSEDYLRINEIRKERFHEDIANKSVLIFVVSLISLMLVRYIALLIIWVHKNAK